MVQNAIPFCEGNLLNRSKFRRTLVIAPYLPSCVSIEYSINLGSNLLLARNECPRPGYKAMVAVTTPQPAPVGTLSPNGSKARFGAAYVRAICSHAGVGFDETTIDEDVLAVDGSVNFATCPARVQIKCTGKFRISGGRTATWKAEESWFGKWQQSMIPVYFVLVVVDPDDQQAWLHHQDDGTLHRTAAFWVRVDQMSNPRQIMVPKTQRLTAGTLAVWADQVNASFGLGSLGGA
jgi:hypothetical protein